MVKPRLQSAIKTHPDAAAAAPVTSGGNPVESGASPPSTPLPDSGTSRTPVASNAPAAPAVYVRPRHFAWADLLRRTFQIDILACPECGGRLRLLATIEERAVVERILKHLGLPVEAPSPAPARSPPWLPGFSDTDA